jgi:hypothetical protein
MCVHILSCLSCELGLSLVTLIKTVGFGYDQQILGSPTYFSTRILAIINTNHCKSRSSAPQVMPSIHKNLQNIIQKKRAITTISPSRLGNNFPAGEMQALVQEIDRDSLLKPNLTLFRI